MFTIEFSARVHEQDAPDFFQELLNQGGGEISYISRNEDGSSACVIIDGVPDIMLSREAAARLGADFIGQDPFYLDKVNKSYLLGIAPQNQTFVIMQEGDYRKNQLTDETQE